MFLGFKDTETQLNALKYLWYLLPDSNRDTLQYLLCFLNKVAKYAEDTTDENDQIVSHLRRRSYLKQSRIFKRQNVKQ